MSNGFDPVRLRKRQLTIATFSAVGSILFMVGVPVIAFLTVFRDVFTQETPGAWQISIFLFVVLVPTVLGSWFITRVSRSFASQTFDPLFVPLGMRAFPYLIYGRQYHGKIQGRRVDIYLHPTQRQRTFATLPGTTISGAAYFGHVLQIYIEAQSTGKMAISLLGGTLPSTKTADIPSQIINQVQDWMFTHGLKAAVQQVSRQYNVATYTPSQPMLKDFSVSTFDQPWTEKMWARPEIAQAAQPLLALAPHSIMFTLQALPACVKLAVHLNKQLMTPEAVESWINQLIRFAQAIESGPQPSVTFQETASEHAVRTNPNIYTRRAIILVVAFFVLLGLGMGLLFFALYYLDQL